MAHQPDHGDTKRDHQDEKDDAALAPFLSERDAPAAGAAIVAPTFVLKCDGDIQPAAAFRRAGQQFFPLPPGRFLGDARRFRDHALELFHFAPHLRFALGEFFLFLVERRSGFRRSAAHAESLALHGHPEENQERDHSKNNQRQRESETDLHPLRERFPAAQSGKTWRGVRQVQVV
ncbi:MAG: hypothetical protein QOC70_2177 [Verrucomicrobiota bacterium]